MQTSSERGVSSIYFCPTCEKPFDEETSHIRHVQYCRRRSKRPARSKACQSCRKAKNKCDFKQPCSRCTTRRIVCSYDKERRTLVPAPSGTYDPCSINSINTAGDFLHIGPQTLAEFSNPSITHDMELNLPLQDPDLRFKGIWSWEPDCFMGGGASTVNSVTVDQYSALTPLSMSSIVDARPDSIRTGSETVYQTAPNNSTPTALSHGSLISSSSFVVDPQIIEPSLLDNTTNSLYLSKHCISNSTRQFILYTLRAYPRMVTRSSNLPPFIHPLGCGHHFDKNETYRLDSRTATTLTPLKSFAACISISHIFVSKTSSTNNVLWQTIEAEQRRLMNEIHEFSLGETLAAFQATIIYSIMRLIDLGPAYFISQKKRVKNMMTLAEQVIRFCGGAFSPPHLWLSSASWENWIVEETRRRITILCFLSSLAMGSRPGDFFIDPQLIPLPSGRALWDAKSVRTWEIEYEAACAEYRATKFKLNTIGDLIFAKATSKAASKSGRPVDDATDALDNWHAGIDGLGMMISSILSEL